MAEALVATASAVPSSTLLVTGAALQVAPNILSIAHRDRLLGGALHALSPLSRVDWATAFSPRCVARAIPFRCLTLPPSNAS